MNTTSYEVNKDVAERVKGIIKHSSKGLFSVEIQKIMFYADCKAVEKYNSRFSNIEYKPKMYGAYSEELSKIINQMPDISDGVFTETSIRNGTTDKKYSYIGELNLNSDVESFIREVIEDTKNKSISDLTKISKDNYIYEQADRGEPLSFSKYRSKLESGDGPVNAITESYSPDPKEIEWGYPLDP
jgi:uncharacterized protein YwgA